MEAGMCEEYSMMRFFVETYYDYQKQRIQTGNRIGSIMIRKLDPEGWQKKKEEDEEKSYGTQYNFREVKNKYLENVSLFSLKEQSRVDRMFSFMGEAEGLEKHLEKDIKDLVKEYPIYNLYLKDVKGISHILSAGLISWVGDISRFQTISKLWAYSGLHVIEGEAARRRKGEPSNWNSRLKTHCWKLGESFVKSRGEYRGLYDKYRAADELLHPEPVVDGKRTLYTKGHMFARAKRKTVKVFLSHLWVRWRELEGLPVSKPFCEEYLGHKASSY